MRTGARSSRAWASGDLPACYGGLVSPPDVGAADRVHETVRGSPYAEPSVCGVLGPQ